MLPVETPFKTYTGLDGKPLDNGYVYFGQPDKDPIAHPVTVYWDVAGTLPAAQPLRTVNGYIIRNGTPANVFYDGPYSELVKDSKGRQVYYARTSEEFSIASAVATFLRDVAGAAGSSLIGFIQAGADAIRRTAQTKLREAPVTPQDYEDLVFIATAKDPGDGNSHYAVNFESWRMAIQRALDVVADRGGGTVLIPWRPDPYLIDDYLIVGPNTRLLFEGTVKLADYTTIGAIMIVEGDNATVDNPLLDGSGIFAGGSGQNGIGIISGNHVRVFGGRIKRCARGQDFVTPGSPNDGGKAIQVEDGAGEDILIDGTAASECFIAWSCLRDGANASPYYGVRFINTKADNCGILSMFRQVNLSDTTGLQHTVQLSNFYAVNCGAFEGAIQLSRASHVMVTDGQVINDASGINTPLIRGNHRNCNFSNIIFSGNADSIVDLTPGTYSPDESYVPENNRYDIHHIGTVNYLINSAASPLKNSAGRFQLLNDVAVGFFGYELRNGNSSFEVSQGGRMAMIGTNTNFVPYSAILKCAHLPLNYSLPTLQYPGGTWTPEDDSGAGLSLAGSYGDYTRTSEVSAAFRITYPVNASAATARVSGLPFPMANKGGRAVRGFSLGYTDIGFPVSAIIPNAGDDVLLFVKMDGSVVTNSQLSGKTIDGILTYFPA